jgi:hypothetical protein
VLQLCAAQSCMHCGVATSTAARRPAWWPCRCAQPHVCSQQAIRPTYGRAFPKFHASCFLPRACTVCLLCVHCGLECVLQSAMRRGVLQCQLSSCLCAGGACPCLFVKTASGIFSVCLLHPSPAACLEPLQHVFIPHWLTGC